MKKLIYTLGMLVSIFSWAQEVPISGNFGGTRCNGSVGLCSVSPFGKAGETPKLYAKKLNDQSFQLIVDRKNMSAEEELKIVGQSFSSLDQSSPPAFVIEEDFILDEQTGKKIGLGNGYLIIPAGNYTMAFDDERIYITFNLEKQ